MDINILKRRDTMGKMSHIAYLCSKGDRDALIDELNQTPIANMADTTVEEVADGFMDAYNTIKEKKEEPAYKKLNEIQTDMIKDATNKISRASVGIRDEHL
jgi:hypothetical protein|tara:strand:- start:1367 stop:1669 length:303 start_codon:yes stop_codon:yes gene_type:complete